MKNPVGDNRMIVDLVPIHRSTTKTTATTTRTPQTSFRLAILYRMHSPVTDQTTTTTTTRTTRMKNEHQYDATQSLSGIGSKKNTHHGNNHNHGGGGGGGMHSFFYEESLLVKATTKNGPSSNSNNNRIIRTRGTERTQEEEEAAMPSLFGAEKNETTQCELLLLLLLEMLLLLLLLQRRSHSHIILATSTATTTINHVFHTHSSLSTWISHRQWDPTDREGKKIGVFVDLWYEEGNRRALNSDSGWYKQKHTQKRREKIGWLPYSLLTVDIQDIRMDHNMTLTCRSNAERHDTTRHDTTRHYSKLQIVTVVGWEGKRTPHHPYLSYTCRWWFVGIPVLSCHPVDVRTVQ